MIKQITTKACETIYDVDGVAVRLWAIVGGEPCVDFEEYTPYSKRFPVVAKYGHDQWIKGMSHYKCQNPDNIQGITFDDLPNGKQDIYDFISVTMPKKELAEKRYNELPILESELDRFWGKSKSIISKRIHDTDDSTYVKAKIDFRKYMIAPVTFSSGVYCGRCDEKIKFFSNWWKLMQAIVNPINDSGRHLWNELDEVEYNTICKMIADKNILEKKIKAN